jgi:hypothetical protein
MIHPFKIFGDMLVSHISRDIANDFRGNEKELLAQMRYIIYDDGTDRHIHKLPPKSSHHRIEGFKVIEQILVNHFNSTASHDLDELEKILTILFESIDPRDRQIGLSAMSVEDTPLLFSLCTKIVKMI